MPAFVRLLFNPYALWPCDKKLIAKLVMRVRTRNHRVSFSYIISFKASILYPCQSLIPFFFVKINLVKILYNQITQYNSPPSRFSDLATSLPLSLRTFNIFFSRWKLIRHNIGSFCMKLFLLWLLFFPYLNKSNRTREGPFYVQSRLNSPEPLEPGPRVQGQGPLISLGI